MSKIIIAALRYTPLLAAFLFGWSSNDYLDLRKENKALIQFAEGFKEINDLYQPQLDALPADNGIVAPVISTAIGSVPKPNAKPTSR